MVKLIHDNRNITGWVVLMCDEYHVEARVFSHPNPNGMWGGRVGKLYVSSSSRNECLFRYDKKVIRNRIPNTTLRQIVNFCEHLES